MTNEMIKEQLLKLRPDTQDFTVIMTGKKSRKVNGLYKPFTREILLHNKNFTDDFQLMYTAIHEFAHHLQFTKLLTPGVARFHTAQFWSIFHELLFEAERTGIYRNIFLTNSEFVELTERIKQDFITEHGRLITEFGEVLLKAHELCDKYNASFDDYVNRVLKIKHSHAQSMIRISNMELDPSIGYENMKAVSRIGDPERRQRAVEDLEQDYSPVMVELKYRKKDEEKDPVEVLAREKKRIEKTIMTLKAKLALIETKIREYSDPGHENNDESIAGGDAV